MWKDDSLQALLWPPQKVWTPDFNVKGWLTVIFTQSLNSDSSKTMQILPQWCPLGCLLPQSDSYQVEDTMQMPE